MLRCTIIFCVLLFASEAIAEAPVDVVKSLDAMYLQQINASLLGIAESVLNASSVPSQMISMLDEGLSRSRWHGNQAAWELRSQIKSFKFTHADVNITDCIELYREQVKKVQFTLINILTCSAMKIKTWYIRDTYNDVMREIQACKENTGAHDSLTTNECYRKAKNDLTKSLRNPEKIKSNMINPDESFIEQTLTDCKDAYKFEEMNNRIRRITNSAKDCINNAEKNDSALDRIGSFIFKVRDFFCDGSVIIKFPLCGS